MSTTPHLGLPLIAAGQAQKHVTHNEGLFALDALVQCAILDRDLAAPPGSPADGARYIVAPSPTGAWAGKSGMIALWQDEAWTYLAPQPGFLAYVLDEAMLHVFTGSAWVSVTHALGIDLTIGRLGIGTEPDYTNPFAAKLNKALWTARAVAEGGTGDLRWTLSKESAAKTLSFLFQTAYSGRVEFGLIGSDNLTAKVSQDGTNWTEALTLDVATGGLDFLSHEAVLASGATVALGSVAARRVLVTGTTTITSFGSAPGRERLVRFAGALILTHDPTSLILPGGANIATTASDIAAFVSDATGHWRCVGYQRANGSPLAAGGSDPRMLGLIRVRQARNLGAAQLYPGAVADGFAGLDGVNTGVSTNYVHDAVNKRITPGQTGTLLASPQTTSASQSSFASNSIFDRSFALASGVTIFRIGAYLTTAQTVSLKIIQRVSSTSYTIVATQSVAHAGGGWQDFDLTAPFAVPGSGTYHLGLYGAGSNINLSASTSVTRGLVSGDVAIGAGHSATENAGAIAVMRYTHTPVLAAMNLVTALQTADATPATMRGIVEIEPTEAIALNIDLTLETSRDGGTTWTASTLAQVSTLGTRRLLDTGPTSVAAQPSGTSVAVRLKTANAKSVRITGLDLAWSA